MAHNPIECPRCKWRCYEWWAKRCAACGFREDLTHPLKAVTTEDR